MISAGIHQSETGTETGSLLDVPIRDVEEDRRVVDLRSAHSRIEPDEADILDQKGERLVGHDDLLDSIEKRFLSREIRRRRELLQ